MTIAEYKAIDGQISARILVTESDKNLGGRDLDFLIAQKVSSDLTNDLELD